MNDPVAVARALAPLLRSRADEGEERRRLPEASVEALRDAGMFRLCVPQCYGGPEVDPMTLVDTIAEVAAADGAAGWCVMIASTTSVLSVLLPSDEARAIHGDPTVVTGGAYAPSGTAERTEEPTSGWRVSGRWQWGSGTDHCDWITAGTITDAGGFRLMFLPARDVELIDTWHSSGLRGTGSGDFAVTGAFVPDRLAIEPGVSTPQVDTPLGRFPIFTLLASGVASATLGMARRAIDEIVALAVDKRPAFSSRTLAKSPLTHLDIARAEAAVGAARAFLLDELSQAWAVAERGDEVPMERRARVRLACSHAATEAARAVDLAYELGGGSSVFASSPLQRCFRDVHTATQHILVSRRPMETVGKLLLGLDADTGML